MQPDQRQFQAIPSAVGLLEFSSWSIGMVCVDGATKSADVQVLSAELNDMLGVTVRLGGPVAAVAAALEAARQQARSCTPDGATSKGVFHLIPNLSRGVIELVVPAPEYNPLIEQQVIRLPKEHHMSSNELQAKQQEQVPARPADSALGVIETQGFTALVEAVDAACKAANVEVVGREKLGGGYISVILRGDVAALRAAVDAAKPRVEGLGKLIATHVIARPSPSLLALLPESSVR